MSSWLRRLQLTAFRNYSSARLDLTEDKPFVILIGHNGAGKTNILEAISLLAPGRGLRGAHLSELQNVNPCYFTPSPAIADSPIPEYQAPKYQAKLKNQNTSQNRNIRQNWSVAGQVIHRGETRQVGTGIDSSGSLPRRTARLDGQPLGSISALAKEWSILWLTPQMDRLFSEGPSTRRRFLDRLTLTLYPDHGTQVTIYEKAVRERNKLLSEQNLRYSASWLGAIETRIATHGVAVAAARSDMVNVLSEEIETLSNSQTGFVNGRLILKGYLEDRLYTGTAPSDLEDHFREALEAHRQSDMRAGGRQEIGPHRSDLQVFLMPKNMLADIASTGEQKALLISLILAQTSLVKRLRGAAPILLLDEIAAHLDENKRQALFDHLKSFETQCFITGTDAEIFGSLALDSLFLYVENGQIGPSDHL